ncbi:MAG: hypothetical protein IJV72_04865 [Clostridia bacterium]|nr:hypothetical protein [Clostridia bacterium]
MEINERALYELSFYKYMEGIGYPAELMLQNFKTLSRHHIDLAVFAEDAVTPVAFFEIKSGKLPLQSFLFTVNEYKKICARSEVAVPCYIAVCPEEAGWEIYDISSFVYGDAPITMEAIKAQKINPPPYEVLAKQIKTKKAIKKCADKQKRITLMMIFCWGIIPAIALIAMILDANYIYTFNTYRLIALGVVILVALLPFFSEISFKDFHAKVNKDGKKDDKNKDGEENL